MFDKLVALIKAEPVLFVAVISTALTLVAAFGLSLSKEQTAAILAFVNALLMFALRGKVSPAGDA